jgi:hypothetical protein
MVCSVADPIVAIKTTPWNNAGSYSATPAPQEEVVMVITTEHISPITSLIAGFLILIFPSLLNYVIALYLIIIGLVGLNGIYHFVG